MNKTIQLLGIFLLISSFTSAQNHKVITNDSDKVISTSPEDIAQMQLNAYNEKDLEAFLSVYDENIEVYNFPNELRFKGKEEMRKLYASFFERAGELHCQLINRITYGNYVMDREHVTTSIPGRESFEGQAIYEVKDGKIIKLWFMKM